MFQSVLEQQEWRARRLGTGAGVSLAVHAGMVAVALIISTRVVEKAPEDEHLVVKVMQAPPRGNPNPPAVKAVADQPKPKPKNRPQTPVIPRDVPQTKPPEVEPSTVKQEDDSPDEALPNIPGSDPNGLAGGTCIACKALENATTTAIEPTGEDTVPFSMGTMTAPQLLSGATIEYTREAREAHVTGMLIAKCTITRQGEVENCRIIKGQPHMNESVLAALETRRYTPVQYQGKPIGVTYIFHVKLDMP